jgi:hypothetical protein
MPNSTDRYVTPIRKSSLRSKLIVPGLALAEIDEKYNGAPE